MVRKLPDRPKRYIFPEKQDGDLALRRGFKIRQGEKVLITEDVVTRGGRVEEALKIVRDLGGVPVAVTVIVNRSISTPDFGAQKSGGFDLPDFFSG